MPKKVQKTLQEYLAKMKSPRHPQIQSAFHSLSSSKNWFLSACKHPKTPSIAFDQSHGGGGGGGGSSSSSSKSKNNNSPNKKDNDDAATLADVDRFLYENFKSLYFRDHDEDDDDEVEVAENIKSTTKRASSSSEEIQNKEEPPKVLSPINLFESPRLLETPRDLICGSTRFFVKPVLSGSLLIDDGATSSPNSTVTNNTDSMISNNSNENHHHHHDLHDHDHHRHQNQALPHNCIALLASTSSPYEDFKRSMQEVVEARCKKQGRSVIDWDFMEDLLFCYLNLNEKKSHKFILSAYVDVVAAMRRNLDTAVPGKPRSVRTVRIASTR